MKLVPRIDDVPPQGEIAGSGRKIPEGILREAGSAEGVAELLRIIQIGLPPPAGAGSRCRGTYSSIEADTIRSYSAHASGRLSSSRTLACAVSTPSIARIRSVCRKRPSIAGVRSNGG